MTWPDLMARKVGMALIWLLREIVSSATGTGRGSALFRCDGLLAINVHTQEVYLRSILCERGVLGRDGLRRRRGSGSGSAQVTNGTHLARSAPLSVEVYDDCSSGGGGGTEGFVPFLDRVDLGWCGHWREEVR